jgi:hypothetical protein
VNTSKSFPWPHQNLPSRTAVLYSHIPSTVTCVVAVIHYFHLSKVRCMFAAVLPTNPQY